jgi:hypothetical protein
MAMLTMILVIPDSNLNAETFQALDVSLPDTSVLVSPLSLTGSSHH